MALPTVSKSERYQEQTAPVQPGQLRGRTAMSKEAMKYLNPGAIVPVDIQTTALLVNALREALAEQPAQQEPVAWLHTKIEGVAVPHRPADLDRHPDRWTPLYKDPAPCPTCEALARTVMLDQTSHDTSPPASKPLTDEQIKGIYEDCDAPTGGEFTIAFTRAIEAAHGIKENT